MKTKGCIPLKARIIGESAQVAQAAEHYTLHMEIQGLECFSIPKHIMAESKPIDLFVEVHSTDREPALKLFSIGRELIVYITLEQLKSLYLQAADQPQRVFETDLASLALSREEFSGEFNPLMERRTSMKGFMAESPMLIKTRAGDVQMLMAVDLSASINLLCGTPAARAYLEAHLRGRPVLISHAAKEAEAQKIKVMMRQGRPIELRLTAKEVLSQECVEVFASNMTLTFRAGDPIEAMFYEPVPMAR